MESHPYEKTPGGGGLLPASVSITHEARRAADSCVCTYLNARGGRCRMLTLGPEFPFCPDHTRKEALRRRREQEALAKKLFEDIPSCATAGSINAFLDNLLRQMALQRIDRKDAIAMAYVSQLLLQSLRPLEREMQAESDLSDADTFRFLRQNFAAEQSGAAAETAAKGDSIA